MPRVDDFGGALRTTAVLAIDSRSSVSLPTFIVDPRHDAALREAQAHADALALEDRRAWFFAMRDIFEFALSHTKAYRIVLGRWVLDAWADFTEHLRRDLKMAFDDLSPVALRATVASHLDALDDDELRDSLADLLAGPEGGLWMLMEGALPAGWEAPTPPQVEEIDERPFNAKEAVRNLLAWSERARTSRPIERVTASELDKAAGKDDDAQTTNETIVACARLRARSIAESVDPTIVTAMRALIDAAPVSRGNGLYDADGARVLLTWLEAAATSAATAWLLPMVQRAVANKRGLVVVFDIDPVYRESRNERRD